MTYGDSDVDATRRVRFFSADDLAAGYYVPRVVELVEQFDPAVSIGNITSAIELHHVHSYVKHGLLPRTYTEEQFKRAEAQLPDLRKAIAKYFSQINNSNVAAVVAGVDHEYHDGLLDLLGSSKAFERCEAGVMLLTLFATGIRLDALLGSRKLVRAYDAEVRDLLRADVENAEHLIRKYLQDSVRGDIHLPQSFTPSDIRDLIDRYLESSAANVNYVGLVESAHVSSATGVDAKLKLKAKRRKHQLTEQFFEQTAGLRTGCEVVVSTSEREPVSAELDGMVSKFTYSRQWLDSTNDYASILNNFQHLFDFADRACILTLPAYAAELGVLERTLGLRGKTDYHFGLAFSSKDSSSLLQTQMMHAYLRSRDINLEEVISWFFGNYLVEQFQASSFSFTPSEGGTSYLQKVRHLFAEMESISNQFRLYVQNGELDRELLAMTSEQVRYKELPTLLEDKYLYPTQSSEIASILHLLFSDQSTLAYVNENLKGENAARLLLSREVTYADFADYQKPAVDHLLSLGVLRDGGTRIELASEEQCSILYALFTTEAAAYLHLSAAGRRAADLMVEKGWVSRAATLLTEAEGNYFNYFLNSVDFSNGPQLRNRYQHGSQVNGEGEGAHYTVYVTALRLIVALVIKINDDFCLAYPEADQDNS